MHSVSVDIRKAELSKYDNKIKTPLDALKVLKRCPIYNAYINVKDIIDDLIEETNETVEEVKEKPAKVIFYNATYESEIGIDE